MMKEERETGSSERIKKQGSKGKPPSRRPSIPPSLAGWLAAEKTDQQLSRRVSEFLRSRTQTEERKKDATGVDVHPQKKRDVDKQNLLSG